MYGGMYPEHILDDDGKKVANPQSITKEQRVHDQVVHDKYWWLVTGGVWRCIEGDGQAPWHDGLLSDEWVRLCT